MAVMNAASARRAQSGPQGTPSVAPHHVMQIKTLFRDVSFYLPNPGDHIQHTVRSTGQFHGQRMLEDLAALLPETPSVVDAGANIGNHTLFFATATEAKVISVERDPQAFGVLQQNVELNSLEEDVELHHLTLGAPREHGEMHNVSAANPEPTKAATGAEGAGAVTTLDSLIGDRHVDMIKIDLAGLEADVLRGASAVLSRCHPILIAEAATLADLAGIESVLRPHGYRKIRQFNETPTYLFQKGLEGTNTDTSYTTRLLDRAGDRLPNTTGIYAGMATVAGNDVAMRAAVMSLLPQVDKLFLYLNGFREIPAFLKKFDKIVCHLDEDGTRFGDAGKFWGLEQVNDAIYMTCDDDILYPVDYTARMVEELAQTGGRGILCVHGSLLLQPMSNFYAQGARSVFHFAQDLIRRRRIHVSGTGTCVFHSGTVRMKLTDFEHRNMADIWLTKYAEENDIPRYVIPRRAAWLTPLKVDRPTIYADSNSATGGKYDTSRLQNSVLETVLPMTLAGKGEDVPVMVLSLEKDENIVSSLDALPFRGRDPVVFVLCDRITDRLKTVVAQKKPLREVHLISRAEPFPEACKPIIVENAAHVEFYEVKNRSVRLASDITEVESWLEEFGTK